MHRKSKIFVVVLLFITVAVLFLGQRYFQDRNDQIASKAIKLEKIEKDGKKKEAKGKSIYFQKSNDVIQIGNKYNKTEDIEVEWGKNGANNLFNFISLGFNQNTEEIVSYELFGSPAFSSATDFIGPHIILAKENINGDKPQSYDFTGGSHAFNGDASGTPTASTTDIKFFVDGKEITEDKEGYANKITIEWTNKVQASNTKKEDGTGREVLEEHFKMTNDGEKYTIESQITFLEDVQWERYYGLQAAYGTFWDEYVSFSDEETSPANKDRESQKKLVSKITLNKDANWLEIGMDNGVGIGDREYLKNPPGAFNVSKANKAYFWLVDGADFDKGDIVKFKGHYRFYSN